MSQEGPDFEWVGRLGIVALTFLFLLTLEDMATHRLPEPSRDAPASIPVSWVSDPPLAEKPPEESADDCTPRDECCRVCKKGKACGDSCIQKALTCHQEDGCACDSEDVCEE